MKFKISRLQILSAIFILGLFFSLRLINLNKLPVFVDEAIYVRWSQVMKAEPTLRFLPQSDGKQPLFMWLTIPALKLIPDPLLAGRLVSVAAGLGSMLGLSLLVFLLAGSLTASLWAAFIYALTPFSVFFDRMSLVDSLLAMFGIWSLTTGLLFVRSRRLDLAMILGFVLGAGLLTKSPAVFFYLWQPILAFFFFRPKISKIKTETLKLLGGWLTAFIISQAMFNILRLGPNFHLINSRNQDYVYSLGEVLLHPLNPLLYNLNSTLSWLWVLLSPPLVVLILAAFITRIRKVSLAFLLISLTPLLAQGLIAKVYTPRYILFATLPLIVIAALLIHSFIRLDLKKFKLKHKTSLLIPLLFLLPLFTSISYIGWPETADLPQRMRNGYLEEWTAGWGQKQVANYLINQLEPGRKIIVGTEGYFGTLPDGLQIYTQNYPQILVIGIGLPVKDIPAPLADALLDPQNDVFLVVNSSRDWIEKQVPDQFKKLQLLAEYPKVARPDGSQEVLHFYQLKRD